MPWNPNAYQPPGVYWEQVVQPSITNITGVIPLTLIGKARASIAVTETVYMKSEATELTYEIVTESSIVVTDLSGSTTYTKDVDYTIVPATETENTSLKVWANSPSNFNGTVSGSGGTFSEDTYTYNITAYSSGGNMETTSESTSNVYVPASGGSVDLSWSGVTGAGGYRIYRGDTGSAPTLIHTITDGATTSWTDTNAASPDGVTTPPSYNACLVTYSYVPEDLFDVQTFTDVDELEKFYGDAVDSSTGAIYCELSFAARLAAANGCTYIRCIGVPNDAVTEDWTSALAKLALEEEIDLVVPLVYDEAFLDTIKPWIANRQNEGKFPFFVLGGRSSSGSTETITIDTLAAKTRISGGVGGAWTSESIVVFAFPTVTYYSSITGNTFEINGYYAAAATAGRMMAQAIYLPITRKYVYGLYAVPKLSSQDMDKYTTYGLFVVFNRGGGIMCRHGVTSDFTSSSTREISVVRAKYDLLRAMINDLNTVIVGTVLDNMTTIQTRSVCKSRLETSKDARLIAGYSELKARLNSEEPTRVDVKFKYTPSWPINWVVIQFSIDTATGEVVSTV